MKLTTFQSNLLAEVCQEDLQNLSRFVHRLDNFVLWLRRKPTESFENLISRLESLSSTTEVKSSEDYDNAIYLLRQYGEAYKNVSKLAGLTSYSVEDLSLMTELHPTPFSEVFRKAARANYFLGLAERLELSRKAEGV